MCIVKVFQQERWGTNALYIEMKNKDGLVEIYGQLVDLVGIENTEKIYYTLRGQQIVFPMRLYKTEFISNEVRRRYNGKNLLTPQGVINLFCVFDSHQIN